MDGKEILRKIEAVENQKKLFKRAIKSRICPECGKPLTRFVGEFCEAVADNAITYRCACGFEHKTREWGHVEGEKTIFEPEIEKNEDIQIEDLKKMIRVRRRNPYIIKCVLPTYEEE